MTLLYLALAYLAGIVLGRSAWDAGLFGCGLPGWLWLPPLALLPLTARLNRLQSPLPVTAMRWPVSAGFTSPQQGTAPGVVAGVMLCIVAGGLRYAAQPLTPCYTPSDLAYWNLPANAAFERAAPQVTLTGYVDGFPVVANDRQEVVVAVTQLDGQGGTRTVTGRARLLTDAAPRHAYGDRVRVTGRLTTPPVFEDFSYRDYSRLFGGAGHPQRGQCGGGGTHRRRTRGDGMATVGHDRAAARRGFAAGAAARTLRQFGRRDAAGRGGGDPRRPL